MGGGLRLAPRSRGEEGQSNWMASLREASMLRRPRTTSDKGLTPGIVQALACWAIHAAAARPWRARSPLEQREETTATFGLDDGLG